MVGAIGGADRVGAGPGGGAEVLPIVQAASETIFLPTAEMPRVPSRSASGTLLDRLEDADALVIGPGLSDHEETAATGFDDSVCDVRCPCPGRRWGRRVLGSARRARRLQVGCGPHASRRGVSVPSVRSHGDHLLRDGRAAARASRPRFSEGSRLSGRVVVRPVPWATGPSPGSCDSAWRRSRPLPGGPIACAAPSSPPTSEGRSRG